MESRDDERYLDSLLEAALDSVGSAEPPPGLAQRIAENVRAAGERRRTWFWWLVPATAAVAIALLVTGFLMRKPASPPAPEVVKREGMAAPQQAVNLSPEKPAIAIRKSPHRTIARPRPQSQVAAVPRRERFPTPAPLTVEERALLAIAQQPRPELVVAQSRPFEFSPIEPGALVVPPLSPENVKPTDQR